MVRACSLKKGARPYPLACKFCGSGSGWGPPISQYKAYQPVWSELAKLSKHKQWIWLYGHAFGAHYMHILVLNHDRKGEMWERWNMIKIGKGEWGTTKLAWVKVCIKMKFSQGWLHKVIACLWEPTCDQCNPHNLTLNKFDTHPTHIHYWIVYKRMIV